MLIKDTLKLAKKSGVVNRLYAEWCFLHSIPVKDFTHLCKVRLAFAVKPYTMLSYPRLSKLYEVASHLQKEGVNGDFVECGVWNGGSAAMLATAIKDAKNRHLWLFDSWEGLPKPTEHDISYTAEQGKEGMALGYEERVRELLFHKLKLNCEMIHLVKGWFNDTLSLHKKYIGSIALLHLDCDWYSSVKCCLDELYDSITPGGFTFIDDYGHWRGCKRATDEFMKERGLKVDLAKIDYTAVYFQKP